MVVGFKEALHRRNMNYKKVPHFRRQEEHRYVRLQRTGWRKPRGIHSKLRVQKDRRFIVKVGYRSDRRVRHLTPDGLRPILIYSPSQALQREWSPLREICVFSSTLGQRKRETVRDFLLLKGVLFQN